MRAASLSLSASSLEPQKLLRTDAAQARAQGSLESIAGVLGFIVSPILGGLSDAMGRRPLMIMSPCFSVLTNILITWRPTVGSLVVRRLLMPFSSTPWHSGEAA